MRQLIYHVFLPLFLGGMIYWAARPNILAFSHSAIQPFGWAEYLPDWLVFNVPDGLWSYALLSLTFILWQNSRSLNALLWLLIAFSLGILLEIAQYLRLISGTFDWLDVFTYLIFNTFSVVQFNRKKNEK